MAGRFKDGADKPLIEDAAWLVLDEARLMEGAKKIKCSEFADEMIKHLG